MFRVENIQFLGRSKDFGNFRDIRSYASKNKGASCHFPNLAIFTSQLGGRSVSRSVGQSVSRSVGQSVSRSVGQSVSRSVSHSIAQES